jgi:hypothetical protein
MIVFFCDDDDACFLMFCWEIMRVLIGLMGWIVVYCFRFSVIDSGLWKIGFDRIPQCNSAIATFLTIFL